MRKQLLMKTFLVAVSLLVGTSAWADDYSIAWQNTFDGVSYSDGWVGVKSRSAATNTVKQDTRSGDEKYISFSNNAYNTVWTYTLSGVSAISSATDYVFEMDFALTRCNASGTTSLKITNASDGELFKVAAPGADPGKGSTALVTGAVYTNGSADAESETVTMNTFRGGVLTWYKITISSNATNGTSLTLTKESDPTETKTYKLSDGFIALGKIILDPANDNQTRYGGGSFDNFVFKTPEDATSVNAPTGSVIDFNGTARTIQFTTLTDGATIYYSETTNDKDVDEWTEYTAAVSTTSDPIYAYAKKGTYTSDVTTFETGAGAAIALNTPTALRTGANTYSITVVATSAYGQTATQTIHYTINGGVEQTASSPANIENVDGDIVAWATAEKFGNSENLNVTFVPAIATAEAIWSYNLNSYPNTHTCTAIADALSTESEADMNGTTMYNLKEEDYANLYIENAAGWLLRNQASNAWKCQSARTSVAFNNVTTSDVIYIYAVNDKSTTNCVYNVTNGEVLYNYSLQHFYIVPTSDGSVKVTFNTGSSINTLAVYSTSVSATIPTSGYGTIASAYALDCANLPAGLKAYQVTELTKETVTLEEVTEAVAAGTGLILKGTASETYAIPVAATGADISATNKLQAAVTATAVEANETYILQGGQFHKVTAASTIPAGKAYLRYADLSMARELTLTFGDATGIGATLKNKEIENKEVYNLKGQRVAQPTKGLYIQNGKKVIVK